MDSVVEWRTRRIVNNPKFDTLCVRVLLGWFWKESKTNIKFENRSSVYACECRAIDIKKFEMLVQIINTSRRNENIRNPAVGLDWIWEFEIKKKIKPHSDRSVHWRLSTHICRTRRKYAYFTFTFFYLLYTLLYTYFTFYIY